MLRKILLASVLAVLPMISFAQAPVTPQTTASQKGTLTTKSLGEMLDGMGLSPKEGKYSNGNPYHDVVVRHDGLDMPTRIALSANGRAIWLHLYLANLPPVDQIPAERLMSLLRRNASETGKAQFCIRGNTLCLFQPVDNIQMTPARLLGELQDLCTVARVLEKDWIPHHWSVAPKGNATNGPNPFKMEEKKGPVREWKDFSDAQGRFKVKLPGTPVHQASETPTPQGPIKTNQFSIGDEFGVSYTDHPMETFSMPGFDSSAFLIATHSNMASGVKGRVLQQRRVTLDGYVGLESVFDLPDQKEVLARSYLVGNRVYLVLAIVPAGSQVASDDVQMFVNSFKIEN